MTNAYRPMGQRTVFDTLCPLHVRFDTNGIIQSVRPTRMRSFDMIGMHLNDVFDAIRPKEILDPIWCKPWKGGACTCVLIRPHHIQG